jgi:hypothetical protein
MAENLPTKRDDWALRSDWPQYTRTCRLSSGELEPNNSVGLGKEIMARIYWFAAVLVALCSSLAIEAAAAPLRVAIVSRTVFYVPVWIADRLGYLKSHGIEPTIEVYDNAEKINEELRSGVFRSQSLPRRA